MNQKDKKARSERDIKKELRRIRQEKRRERVKDERKNVFKIIRDWFSVITVAFLLGFIITRFAFMINVPTGSMIPTIDPGDRIYVKRVFKPENLKRGDIVVFLTGDGQRVKNEPAAQHFVKRLIGLPGDKVKITKGKVSVNGEALKEDYVENNEVEYSGEFTVPEGKYFFLGDNRDNSFDSRYWDDPFISADKIKAVAGLKVFPFSHFGFLK